jgi:protein involved in polysaccharide export with SLBB domain
VRHTLFRLLPLLAGLATACADGPATPPPPAPQLPQVAAPYRVQVGDQLAIRLFLTPELNEDVTVRPDGRITTQLVEAVPAAGLTPEAIAVALRTGYGSELRDPRITVEVKSYSPVRVYVAGEVVSPGEITTGGPPPTLLAAVARAGGVRLSGDMAGVLIVRRGEGDRPAVFATRYADALSGRDPAADVVLQPYDIVIVPKTGVAELYAWVNQHIQQFVPVSWGFSYNVNPFVTTTK